MKKTIAMLLALIMVLACTVALADDPPVKADPTPLYQIATADNTITITKNYTVLGVGAVNSADTLKFEIAGDHIANATDNTMTIPAASIAQVAVDGGAKTATIGITLPTYTTVGEYFYNITETNTGVAGVTYLTDTIVMKVQVFYNPDTKALDRYVTFRIGDNKIDSFTNTYEAGTLTVSKTVTGNMGDVNKEWNFTVVFKSTAKVMGDITATNSNASIAAGTTGWTGEKTATFKLKSGESVKFSNIPKGVTYTVAEAEAGADGYTTTVGTTKLEKAEDVIDGEITAHEDDTVDVLNNKDVPIDTGVTLDSAVYVLIMALALAGFVALKVRRREDY